MKYQYADRMANMKESEIRELLKLTERPEVISFAGGLPAPELFPMKEIKEVTNWVLDHCGETALQYTTTEGLKSLRGWIANRMNAQLGTTFDEDNIMLTHGSQQALDFLGKIFLDKGDTVLCESPTYLAAISAFRAYECQFAEIESDDCGMRPASLEQALIQAEGKKVIYVIPNFQNPTGRTWSLERRKKLAELAAEYHAIVLEDNPYGELRFEGDFLPSIKSFDTTGNVLCTGSFSKIFCPGYRIGWVAGEKELIQKFVLVKQGADLQCNTMAQLTIASYLEKYDIDEHIHELRRIYKRRRDLAMETIRQAFPLGVQCTKPDGGLFLWVELPDGLSATTLLKKCIARNVAFVPGNSFYPNTDKPNTMRINFSNSTEEKLVEGLTRIGAVMKEMLLL